MSNKISSYDAFYVGVLVGMYDFSPTSGTALGFMNELGDDIGPDLNDLVRGRMLVEVANGRAVANVKLENEMLVPERISFNEWKALPPSTLVYLPENADEFLTKRDFTALCTGDASSNLKSDPESILRRAFLLLLQCEWQHPATIIDDAGGLDGLFGVDYLEDLPLPSVRSQVFMNEGVGEIGEIDPTDRTIYIKPVHVEGINTTVSGWVSFDKVPYTVRAPLNGMHPQRDAIVFSLMPS